MADTRFAPEAVLAQLRRLWRWWFLENGRWIIEEDLIRRGLLHGPEGGYFREFRSCPEWPVINRPRKRLRFEPRPDMAALFHEIVSKRLHELMAEQRRNG